MAPKPQRADFKEKSTSPSKSRSPIQERSRSSSKGKRRYKRRRDDDSSEEKKVIKKKDKERKKKSHEKAKFSSESEGGGDEGEEEEERGARFSDDEGGFANSKIVGSSSPVVKKPSQPFKATSDSRPDASQPVMGNGIHKPLPGSWLNINYLKGKIRIFASDAKKNENQGYSVSCHLYTSEPEEVVHQFPDFSKVVTFVFDKYMKEADEIEMHYQRKIAQMKRSPIPPSSQTIIAGWMVPAEGESKDKEQHKLSYLESYLSKKPVSISYNPTAGLTVWVVMGKWLKNETLKAIGIKDKYDSDRTIKLDKQIIFFLRRNIEKEDPNSKKLTSRVVQAYDKQKEASLKYVFGTRTENPNEEKHKDTKRQGESNTQKSVGEGQVQKGTEQPVLDQSMREMLVLLRELSTQEAKEFFESITDKNLKQKLRNIITEHLPDLLAVITEQQALDSDRISSMGRPPLPMPSMQPPFYPHAPHLGAPQMKPIQGHPPQGFMGYDPTKMMQMAPLPHQPQPQPSAGQMGGMPYRQPPSLPMNPFMNKPPPMMMPLRPTPGMGAPPGQLNPQPGPMGAPPGQGLMGPPQANLPTATMNTPVGGNHGGGMGYSPLTINPQLGGQQNPPQMMYPNMMPMGGPGSYQMMGVPYIYSMPPPQMKPPMMPGQSMNPENDRKMQGQQLPK